MERRYPNNGLRKAFWKKEPNDNLGPHLGYLFSSRTAGKHAVCSMQLNMLAVTLSEFEAIGSSSAWTRYFLRTESFNPAHSEWISTGNAFDASDSRIFFDLRESSIASHGETIFPPRQAYMGCLKSIMNHPTKKKGRTATFVPTAKVFFLEGETYLKHLHSNQFNSSLHTLGYVRQKGASCGRFHSHAILGLLALLHFAYRLLV